jgi:hypothetical protein
MHAVHRTRLTLLNVAMCTFHTIFAGVVLSAANMRLSVPLYDTALEFEAATAMEGMRLIPTYVESGGLRVSVLAVAFFACSAVAHLGNAVLWRSSYLNGLARGQCASRWVEYFVSASVMMLAIAYTSGIRCYSQLLQIFALTATTMTFGWLNEVINRPSRAGDDRWEHPFLYRAQAHLCGYVPQVAAWYCILYAFLGAGDGGACGPPDFVYFIVLGEAIVFFSFGLPQLYQVLAPPSRYVYGEYAYQVLSLTAKGLLGMTLLLNVLIYDSFDEAISTEAGSGEAGSGQDC